MLFWVTPGVAIAAIGAIASSPAQAGTLSFSGGMLEFENFSHSSYSTGVLSQTNTLAIAGEGSSVNAMSQATANFWNLPNWAPLANLASSSLVLGQGSDYLGKARSQAHILGNFSIGESESFSFDFNAFLTLGLLVEEKYETAKAKGTVSFGLFDTTKSDQVSLLDSVTLSGKLSPSPGDSNFINYQSFGQIQATDSSYTAFDSKQKFAQQLVSGSLQRYFENPTHLTLVAFSINEAEVQVPEPTATFALFLVGIGFCVKNKQKKVHN
ncbi:PEP-CTERM sorting domain-containing protein [Laspinema sp. A4]|uniref:PEP-CTERM sorting domain-containing protein n=1 Tax=Laspinema sp. D2d TaxID=2953686 RepID=UPI0021BA8FEA|nr:PEP-CTERM sorting domain-containing protein [Laspinema sp. D2d]MCT7982171.1 PEP-CTERM sorting domain-containing protein [Laspinema sp. D2d]